MILEKVLLCQIVLFAACNCEAASTYLGQQASRKLKKLIESYMDVEAEPCNDFFQYACGNWGQIHTDAGVKYYEPISLLSYNLNEEMSNIFNRFLSDKKPKFIQQAHNYYKSCTNVKEYAITKYLSWLETNDNFKWPGLWTEPKNNTQFDWVQMLAKMRTYGFNEVFIQQSITRKLSDAKTNIIELDKPVVNGGFQPLTEDNLNMLLGFLTVQFTSTQFQSLWKEVEEFEAKVKDLNSIKDIEVESDDDYEKVRLYNVENLPLEWLKDYLKVILNQTELNGKMQLYLQNTPYMKALDELLAQYSQHFLCRYLEIRFSWYFYLNDPAYFRDIGCLSSTRRLMPIAMHWQYEQHHPELLEEYTSIYEIFNNIRKVFNATVISNKYGFDDSVVRFLQNKLNKMQLRLNNVPRNDTIETLEKFYHSLNLGIEDFYENFLQLLRFEFLAYLDVIKTRSPVLDITYLEHMNVASSSSPYYLPRANTVFVPLPVLQLPIYSPGLEDIYQYSSLGFVLAHEIFHGFDDNSLQEDVISNLKIQQFTKNPLFNASMNCLREIDPNIINEKIADISGLRYAYQAYFDSTPDASTKTIYLHGNVISPNKMFFLNFAQFFCGKLSKELKSEAHGYDSERVRDALIHFSEFSKEFKCNTSHKLYSDEACYLWR